MVLRRPYAFLIKHFRLIHLIITALFALTVRSTRNIYSYINGIIDGSENRYNALDYINYNIYIYIFIALILCFFVYWLLKFKNKPRKIYIFTLVGYFIIAIFMLVLFSYMNGFSNNMINQKTIRLYRDIFLMTLVLQYFVIVFMLIRGLGFDIKRFNFGKDVQELNANAEDSEEIEINTQVDTTNVVRLVRKQGREFGYFYKEFKKYIIVILVILVGIVAYKSYNYFTDKLKVYKENETIGAANHITVKNSYYATKNNKNYIIINFDISRNITRNTLNIGNMILTVGNKKYTPDKNICYKFNDLGTCYKKQYINKNTANYILVYEVDNLKNKNSYLLYTESYDVSYKVKLNLKSIQE